MGSNCDLWIVVYNKTMQPLNLKSIEERPLPPSKKQKQVTVRFTYQGYDRKIAWNNKYPTLKAAQQAIKDAWTKQDVQTVGLTLLSAEII